MNKKQKKMLARIVFAAVWLVVLHFAPVNGMVAFALYMIPYGVIGYDILRKAFLGICNRKVFDECFLMAVATLGAIGIAVVEQSGDYAEAVAVMLFYQIGELFESYAVGKSRRNITELMDIRPDYANIEQDGELVRVDPDEVEVGSVIVVQPGEKVPLDGVVLEGSSSLNTVALTGESVPRTVRAGDELISGCINMTGVLKVQTTREFDESTVSKILDLVENASSRKSRSENFISRFARVYTPAVCWSALALAVLPPVVRLVMGLSAEWFDWVYRALTFLVISCPCALVISIPLSFFAGIGAASSRGILVKGSNFLEALAQTKWVVFDKTGTLTQGVFEVTAVQQAACSREELLDLAAHAESASSHPIAKSILQAYGKEPQRSRVKQIQERSGYGITAVVDGKQIAIGNRKLMEQCGVVVNGADAAGTVIHLAVNGGYGGCLVISDVVKPTAAQALAELGKLGVRHTVMLTGDAQPVAAAVAQQLGICDVYSELLPADKVQKVEQFLAQKHPKEVLAFVGDGINDAPVLTRADLGIAMGAMGSDAAIEAADIVLMDDDPKKIALAMRIAKKCLRIVYQNIYLAIGIKLICLLLGAIGVANMWLAIFADVGVMVLAVLNAIRVLLVKKV